MSDEPLTTCADCGGSLRKLLFPVGIVFKGSGFYVNDYKNKEPGNGSRREKSGESPSSDEKPKTEKSSTESTTPSSTSTAGASTTSTTS
jgi:predicted nucleic acid-binding Zn ribbon protein